MGTHYGFSYFAFCEAVAAAGLQTECFAVDTWQGDEHAGLYGEEVYDRVTQENVHYSFSTLLRKTFAEALNDIEDGSVDLLHVDGRHFYEDVKEDFESWIPKLSRRAIVLFHDTEVRNRGFGVFRYWEELVKQFPAVNFPYQHGLGVLFFGDEFTDEIAELVDLLTTTMGRELVTSFFTLAGERFFLEQQITALLAQVAGLGSDALLPDSPAAPMPREIQALPDRVISVMAKRDAIFADKLSIKEGELRNKDRSIAELADGLRRAQKLLRKPMQSALRRNLAKFAVKHLFMLSDEQRDRLTASIAKREYRTMFGLLDPKGQFRPSAATTLAAVAPPPARLVPVDPKFSPEASEAWKATLRGTVARLAADPPLVSIIMPTKNRLHVIEHAILSVLAQNYGNWELIIVDDGSSDGTVEAIPERWTDPRIRLLHTEGRGVCAARNTGLKTAQGDIIAYLDDDNRWRPDYLEITLLEMLRSGASCCYSAVRRLHSGFDNPEVADTLWVAFDLPRLKLANYIDLNVFAHRRHVFEELGGFDETLRRMVDWDLIIRYCAVHPPALCNSIGADYDNSHNAQRISVTEHISYLFVVRNKHMIDWAGLRSSVGARDPELVSVIICVYNNPELTDKCLTSIFRHEAGLPFEVVVVDNGSNAQTVDLLRDWAEREPRIKLLLNPENMNFSLGNNLGFAMSRGEKVVFLNNDTEVTPEWLRSLLAPLEREEIRAVQPKLVFPDGTVQSIGLIFSDHSPFAYGLYTGRPSDDPLTGRRRWFKALTAACIALRASDFVEACGFDPLFVNGQEDVDLCLRIGQGKPVFTCATDSVVIHHEGKSEGRGKAIPVNRAIFAERWSGKIIGDDKAHYDADGVVVESYAPSSMQLAKMGLATQIPRLVYPRPPAPALAVGVTALRLRIPCPRPQLKDRWGDYHFAVALAKSSARLGLETRIDFLESWSDPAAKGEADLVLRGLSMFPTPPAGSTGPRLMWMISHPDKVTEEEIDGYDSVFVASDHWARELGNRGLKPTIRPLLQCTETERFNLDARIGAPRHERLYVGNSRKILRSTIAKAIAEEVPLDIYGEMWEGLAPSDWIRAENVANIRLPAYYAAAGVVLNDHWDSMRSYGFVSNRIFDVLATGAPLLTDSVAAMPEEVRAACTILEDGASLRAGIEAAKTRRSQAEREEIADWITQQHSFGARVREICAALR
ncbi:glycosyltransferase [Aquamicrobium terrae]|uniref:Glycosyltransferase involved in cell wall biosynthesis n=1 Tax=Aquamicrobium terrae TaxID=1324945 RepID=A0ABV2N1N9_9HYPH